MRYALYAIAVWLIVFSVVLAVMAAGVTSRRQRAVMITFALAAAGLAAVQILAAGEIR